MITDPRVFDDEHIPRELVHRHTELEKLARALDPGWDGAGVDDVLIAGPSGVGKTVLAKHYLTRATNATSLQWAYVACLGETTGTILREALRGLDDTHVPPNTPVDDVRRGLAGVVDDHAVIILDEADDLPEKDVLDQFAGIAGLSLIVVCHDRERWTSRLDDQHQTRFRSVIQPDRYSVDELTDILRPRARQGLEPNAVGIGELREIADGSAGVARRGIQALRAAAELAAERGHGSIQEEDVEDCFDRARKRIRASNLASLPFHHQVLYEIIRTEGNPSGHELHRRYDEYAHSIYDGQPLTPISKRSRRTKLAKLQDYGLVERDESGSNVYYSAADPEISSAVRLPMIHK
ncbi:Cdc6/Cdc18 family protein [Halobacterium hubeiense]|uniref:Cdc6/Cdc18 family protein n=1 Tax=Halobacterium hubeiense TaxID=1407499 RepID=UPI000B7E3DA5|nr:AAA family ATPase [Halobacterium hubeiense]